MSARDAEEEEAEVDPMPLGGDFGGRTRECHGQMSLELTKPESNENEDNKYKMMEVH